MIAVTITNTNTTRENNSPPFMKAYGSERVPAPIHVVSRANTDEKKVPFRILTESPAMTLTFCTSGSDSKLVLTLISLLDTL